MVPPHPASYYTHFLLLLNIHLWYNFMDNFILGTLLGECIIIFIIILYCLTFVPNFFLAVSIYPCLAYLFTSP